MEYKEMAAEFKSALETAQAEAKAAKEQVSSLEGKISEKENEINNLDNSVKSMQTTIAELKASIKDSKPMGFKAAMRNALEEAKPAIEEFLASKKDKKTFELKMSIATNFTNYSYGVAQDFEVHASLLSGNAFITAFGLRPRTGSKLSWIECEKSVKVAYVQELTAVASANHLTDFTFVEKQREFGKACTYIQLSTESQDWFNYLVDYCQNEGARQVDNFIDQEIYKGAGADGTKPREIYGLKTNSTAFAHIGSGITSPNIADVIADAAKQIAKNNYSASVAIVSWKGLSALESLKDDNGNYIYDKAKGILNGITILPSTKVADDELFVADRNCVQVYAGNSYELEFDRNAAIDGWNVYFRKAAQVKVPTPEKKGVIYVANYTTAAGTLE